jgi:hypothetical protein
MACSAVDGDTEGVKGHGLEMRPARVPAVEPAIAGSNPACRPPS